MSRVHAIVELVGARWTFVDDGLSRNGSYTGGAASSGVTHSRMETGCAWGDTVLIYHDPAEREAESRPARLLAAVATALTDAAHDPDRSMSAGE